MTRDEHTAKIREIQALVKDIDDGKIVSALADLSDDYGSELAEIDRLTLSNQKLTQDNESLRDTNMRLFLKVGDNHKPLNDSTGTEDDSEPTININELFNEKGELK